MTERAEPRPLQDQQSTIGLLFVSAWRASQMQLSAAVRLIHAVSLTKGGAESSSDL